MQSDSLQYLCFLFTWHKCLIEGDLGFEGIEVCSESACTYILAFSDLEMMEIKGSNDSAKNINARHL